MKKFYFLFFVLFSLNVFAQENCNNGIDDDGDGKIDLNDSECICNANPVISLLPNPSFETYSSCPTGYSQLSLSTPWYQSTNGTTDFFNTCGSNMMPAIMTTALLQNFPDGNGIVGAFYRDDWKEYLGLHLSTPLIAGTDYQLTFQIAGLISNSNGYAVPPYTINAFEPVNVTIFGNPNNTTFPLNTLLSPDVIDPNWVDIGHVKYVPTSNWSEITILFTPNMNINSLMIGAPTTLPVSYDNPESIIGEVYPYFLYDNLILNKSSDFKINITSIGDLCSNNLVLQSNLTSNFPSNIIYQWYKNNIAISGANNPTYAIPFSIANVGSYCVKITDGSQCYISNHLDVKNRTLSPNIVVTQPTCINLTGSINVTSASAEYSFNGGISWQNNPNSGPLQPSRYFVKTKNTAGCISESIAIDLLPAILLNPPLYTTIQPSCPNEQGSGISITIDNIGSLYSFNDGLTWTTNNTANNLIPNLVYYLRYKDINGCMSKKRQVHVYPQYIPNPPNLTVNQPTSCSNNLGTITVTTNAVSYSYDNGLTWSNNSTSPPLAQGTYYVKIKPSNNSCVSLARLAVINTPIDAPSIPFLNISQPSSCSNPYGSITVTNIAYQYSFDNGLTWLTNPNSGPLTIGNYQVKVRNILNCESSAVTAIILAPIDYPPTPNFTTVQPDCSNLKGSISITSLANEYSFDDGITWTLNSTLANLIPGSYQIRIKNSIGCVSPASNVVIVPFTDFPDLPISNSQQVFCIQDNATIQNIAISGQNIQWYDALTNGNLLINSTALQNGATYYASQTITNCESKKVPVTINIQNTPAPTGDGNQSFCSTQNATLNDVMVNGSAINWYATASSTTVLPLTTTLINGTTYYATQTVNNCESINRLGVTISLINTLNANDYSKEICDDLNDGTETVLLTDYNASLISNVANCTFAYYHSFTDANTQNSNNQITNVNYTLSLGLKTFYVRIISSNSCHQIVELKLTLLSKPIIPIKDIMPICEGSSITVSAGLGFDSYLWSTGEISSSIVILTPGNYSVTVTENHATINCSSTKNFTVVKSNIATISEIITSDWTVNENIVTILLTENSVGNYDYSLDGIHYQDSNVFSGLVSGEYTVFVRDKNGCGIQPEDFYLLMYPKFFTPNGDGFNDTWKIKFSANEPGLKVRLFDRFGKFLKELDNISGWNGTLNNQELPATDYWFVVTGENGKEYRGHFALKR